MTLASLRVRGAVLPMLSVFVMAEVRTSLDQYELDGF